METRFAKLIWNNEPISSGDLVKLCEYEAVKLAFLHEKQAHYISGECIGKVHIIQLADKAQNQNSNV